MEALTRPTHGSWAGRLRLVVASGVLLFIAGRGFWQALTGLAVATPPSMQAPDASFPARVVQHVAPARSFLGGQARVGYLNPTTDAPPYGTAEFCLARLSLLPTMLTSSSEEPVVMAYLPDDAHLERLLAGGEFVLRARVGPGVAILERKP